LVNYIKFKRELVASFIFIFLAIGLIQFIPFSYAQDNGFSNYSNFELHEYSEITEAKENVTSLNIEFPEVNWSMTDIEINFTDIELEREIKTIEDTKFGDNYIYRQNNAKKRLGLGLQLEITDPSILFGVYIKGERSDTNETIQFQLRGYDEENNKPNNTIYRTMELNISVDDGWYYQNFSADPYELQIGNYSLVMLGDDSLSIASTFSWFLNEINPSIPNLHTSEYVNSWSDGLVNTTFLCKLNHKTEKVYYPQDINMKVAINGEEYEIINGPIVGSGFIEIHNVSYFQDDYVLTIPIKNNISVSLIFNCNYSVNITNSFSSTGSIKIEENLDNVWTMLPVFSRISNNYYVKFEYPKSWFYLTVYRKLGVGWENITSLLEIDKDKNTIIIPNNTILDGAEWKIEANSPNINFNMEMLNTEWKRGDELEFSVNAPVTQGNITFIIIKPSGKAELVEIKEAVSGLNFFSFEIPSNWTKGTYIGEIYWNNETDVGMLSQEFQISIASIPFTMDPWMIFAIILITVGISVAGIMSYRTIKTMRNKQAERKQKLYDSCIDILNLDYIMVTDKKSGLNVYTQSFVEKAIDASLISGFLQAIHSFGIELIKVEDQSQTIKLEYKDSIILMSEFVNIRLILIMKERPSRFFLYSIEELAYDIYKNYGNLIDTFNGDVKPFQSIEPLLKQHLNVSFVYPLRIAQIEKLEKIRITQSERVYINKAVSLMKTKNMNHFYIKSLLPGKECSPKDVETILNLLEKKIFQLV